MKKVYKLILIGLFTVVLLSNSKAQILTNEDSLAAGLTRKSYPTVISGYGEGMYQHHLENKSSEINLTRAVMFLGHRFSDKIQFFSELEIEDAKIAGGSPGGEISFEQCFVKYNVTRDFSVVTGLFIPRIGIINENHLPTTYNGNERPRLEKYLIPSTWRELGVGIYGNISSLPGLNYSAALVNGLDASGFNSDEGIREARFEGKEANAKNLAATGALLYYAGKFRVQLSTYYGGCIGMDKSLADSLGLKTGAFATPVNLNEFDIQYKSNGLSVKAIAANINVKDAYSINKVYGNSVGKNMLGGYIEVGYNLLNIINPESTHSVILFSRYENFNLHYVVPGNAVKNEQASQQHLISGITYLPCRGVAIKADHRYTMYSDNTVKNFINLGFCYSF